MRIQRSLKIAHIAVCLITICIITACGTNSGSNNSEETTTEVVPFTGSKNIDLETSSILWKGYKIMGNHAGTIKLAMGKMSFANGQILSGAFNIDMASVITTEMMEDDEEDEEEEGDENDADDLVQHLMSEDFFDSEQFPLALFVITDASRNIRSYQITGDLTITGVTKEVTFQSKFLKNTFHGTISIDRTEFGIKYGSGNFFDNLGDNAIKDNFDLEISLKFL